MYIHVINSKLDLEMDVFKTTVVIYMHNAVNARMLKFKPSIIILQQHAHKHGECVCVWRGVCGGSGFKDRGRVECMWRG